VGAVLVAAALTAAAIVNTFFWHYWTLAYLRLRERFQQTGSAVPAEEQAGRPHWPQPRECCRQ
jgi:hypothetical protein